MTPSADAAAAARFVRDALPPGGLFAGQTWRIATAPLRLPSAVVSEIETLGRVLLQFYRAANLLLRQSEAGKQPAWVAAWLNRGKPEALLGLQRHPAFKNELPRILRPDLLLTSHGLAITELDSVPGGVGLTAWLNRTYSQCASSTAAEHAAQRPVEEMPGAQPAPEVLGGARGMLDGFASVFDAAPRVHVVISAEAATYRPEMAWLCEALGPERFQVRDTTFTGFQDGDAVYRFFELFDLANVPCAQTVFEGAAARRWRLTPPPKPALEEKMLLALLWNRHVRGFWHRELGESFLQRLLRLVPYSWVVDPAPLPPHGAIPELDLVDWTELKSLSQRERQLILKISGFHETAWGARGVFLGSDLSHADWSAAVDQALRSFDQTPYVLQRYQTPSVVEVAWHDFERDTTVSMPGKVRLSPYYFVTGDGDAARANLGGVLATVCPADKKIIHGMRDAVLAPCSA
jgi:hypothetical protein